MAASSGSFGLGTPQIVELGAPIQFAESGITRRGIENMGKLAIDTIGTPEVIDLGRITDMVWPGSVSARRLIEEGLTTEGELDAAINDLERYYVPVDLEKARTRCIDGRHNPNDVNLGPQVPGGAPGAALANRLAVVNIKDLRMGSFLVDARNMALKYKKLGFFPGGHRDERHEDDENYVGCGLVDELVEINRTMVDARYVDDHEKVVETILGDQFDDEDYFRVLGSATYINGYDEYFKNRGDVLKELEADDPESVPVLRGKHKECLAVVNMVPGTTLASNKFAEDHRGAQAFGYDIWWSYRIADGLFPDPKNSLERSRFVMARVMTTVATLMALTDGSQRLVIRR